MENVDYVSDPEYHSTEQLLNNQLPTSNGEIVSTTVLTVSSPGDYDFTYTLDPWYYKDTCYGVDSVLCIYDVAITIYDNQEDDTLGTIYQTHIGNTAADIQRSYPMGVGTYIVTKVLTPNQDSLDAYLQRYIETQACLPSADLAWDSCDFDCGAHCYQLIVDSVLIGGDYVYLDAEGNSKTIDEVQDLIEDCLSESCNTNNTELYDECARKKRLMCMDLQPGGQYFDNLPKKFDEELKPRSTYDINDWLRNQVSNSAGGIAALFSITQTFANADEAWDYVRANWVDAYDTLLFAYHPEYCS
jgi:hypothetical protein